MLTAAKLVLPALAAALFVWGAAWCVVRTLRPQMADTAAVGGEPPRSSKAMAALAGLLFVCVLQLVFCHAAQANNPGVGLAQAMEWQFYGNTDARHYIDLAQYGYGTGGAFAEQELMIVFFPLFPALLRVVHLLVGGSYPLLGLAVQGPLFAGAMGSSPDFGCAPAVSGNPLRSRTARYPPCSACRPAAPSSGRIGPSRTCGSR